MIPPKAFPTWIRPDAIATFNTLGFSDVDAITSANTAPIMDVINHGKYPEPISANTAITINSMIVNCHILPILRVINTMIAPDSNPHIPGLMESPNGPISDINIAPTKYTITYKAVSNASNTKSFIFKFIFHPSFL